MYRFHDRQKHFPLVLFVGSLAMSLGATRCVDDHGVSEPLDAGAQGDAAGGDSGSGRGGTGGIVISTDDGGWPNSDYVCLDRTNLGVAIGPVGPDGGRQIAFLRECTLCEDGRCSNGGTHEWDAQARPPLPDPPIVACSSAGESSDASPGPGTCNFPPSFCVDAPNFQRLAYYTNARCVDNQCRWDVQVLSCVGQCVRGGCVYSPTM